MAVQHVGRLGTAGELINATTLVVTLTAGLGTGNHATVLAGQQNAVSLSSVADSRGNTWTVHRNGGGTASLPLLASAKIETALQASDTVTLTFSGSADRRIAAVDGWSGLHAGAWFDASAGDASLETDTTLDAGPVSVSTAPALLLAASYASGTNLGSPFVAGGDWTGIPQYTYDNGTIFVYLWSEWRRVTATGNHSATGTVTGSHADMIAAFTEAPSGGGGPPASSPGGKGGPGKGGGGNGNRPRLGGATPRKLRLGGGSG